MKKTFLNEYKETVCEPCSISQMQCCIEMLFSRPAEPGDKCNNCHEMILDTKKTEHKPMTENEILEYLNDKHGLTPGNRFKGYLGISNKYRTIAKIDRPDWKMWVQSPDSYRHLTLSKKIESLPRQVYNYIKNKNYGLDYYLDDNGETGCSDPLRDKEFLKAYGCSPAHMAAILKRYGVES